MIDRIVRSEDFERVLRCPPRAKSAHFALHHLAAGPSAPLKPLPTPLAGELSTGHAPLAPHVVDDLPAPVSGRWLGIVLPKRHARRSVTRTLLKRQIRAAVAAREAHLPVGLWVVRLRAPYDRSQFPSAASDALRGAARAELGRLLGGA